MNGFADRQLDESAFGEKKTFTEGLRTFDAFRKWGVYLVFYLCFRRVYS